MEKQYEMVDGVRMAYIDHGEGDAIVFLHGNPTSSYLWRKVMPALQGSGRLVAPDLIGMGDSDKLPGSGPGSYRFVEHRRYLDALLDRLELGDDVTLVIHDWGGALGFDWARRHPGRVAGIAYMETLVQPGSWEDWPEVSRSLFHAMRTDAGETIILEKNVFVEKIVPASVVNELSEEAMEEYRRPFAKPGEARRPTLTWPRELPIDGEPADVHQIVSDYAAWLPTSPFPKLFVNGDPGFMLAGPQREFCRTWANQTEVTVTGTHFVQEDSGEEIGEAIRTWMDGWE